MESTLFPKAETPFEKNPTRLLPDFAAIPAELREHKHLTLQLLWKAHRRAYPNGYGSTRFGCLYQRWLAKPDLLLRQEHKAGEKMFVDWAGDTIPSHGRQTGEAWRAPLFVAALCASPYT